MTMTDEKARAILKRHAAAYGDSQYEPTRWEVEALQEAAEAVHDDLAAQLLERGGYGMLQLNPNPHAIPRIKFANPEDVQPVAAAKIAGAMIVRNAYGKDMTMLSSVANSIKVWAAQWWKELLCRHQWSPVYHSYRCTCCGKLDKEF